MRKGQRQKRRAVRAVSSARRSRVSSDLQLPEETNQYRDGVFHASLRQQHFIDTLLAYDGSRFSIKAVCKQAGISRSVYYFWVREPEFVKWMNQYRAQLAGAKILLVDKVLYGQALRGKAAALRLVYEKHGELRSRLDVDVAARVQVEKTPEAFSRLLGFLTKMKLPPGVVLPWQQAVDAEFTEVKDGPDKR